MSHRSQILIEGLDLFGHHGCFDEEAKLGQHFLIDLVLDTDIRAAALSDDLADTVDYGAVVETVAEAFSGARHKLLETLARTIAEALLVTYPPVAGVTVTLRKPSPPIARTLRSAGVTLSFQRDD